MVQVQIVLSSNIQEHDLIEEICTIQAGIINYLVTGRARDRARGLSISSDLFVENTAGLSKFLHQPAAYKIHHLG